MISFRRELHEPPRGARAGVDALYAMGDVHGCYDLLHALLGEIGRDAAHRQPEVVPTLIVCGDYVDRGPASSKVLAALTWLKRSSAIDVKLLEGNHEAMLEAFIEDPEENGHWLDVGGRETLASYGVRLGDPVTAPGDLTVMRDALLDQMPLSHHKLLGSLEQSIEVGAYAFVHAGVRPGVPLAKQTRDDLLWIRDEFLYHPSPSSSVIVHGHSWIDDRPSIRPHRIGLDTGAYETGVLTAVRIEDEEIEVIQAVASG